MSEMTQMSDDQLAHLPDWKRKLFLMVEQKLKLQDEIEHLRKHRLLEEDFKESGFDVHFNDEIRNTSIGK